MRRAKQPVSAHEIAAERLDKARAGLDRNPGDGFAEHDLDRAEQHYERVHAEIIRKRVKNIARRQS